MLLYGPKGPNILSGHNGSKKQELATSSFWSKGTKKEKLKKKFFDQMFETTQKKILWSNVRNNSKKKMLSCLIFFISFFFCFCLWIYQNKMNSLPRAIWYNIQIFTWEVFFRWIQNWRFLILIVWNYQNWTNCFEFFWSKSSESKTELKNL